MLIQMLCHYLDPPRVYLYMLHHMNQITSFNYLDVVLRECILAGAGLIPYRAAVSDRHMGSPGMRYRNVLAHLEVE